MKQEINPQLHFQVASTPGIPIGEKSDNVFLFVHGIHNMCSHLQKKLFEEDGVYHRLWMAMQDDSELTAVVRSRQLHIYRNGKKVLVLAGKTAPKIIREDPICGLLSN